MIVAALFGEITMDVARMIPAPMAMIDHGDRGKLHLRVVNEKANLEALTALSGEGD